MQDESEHTSSQGIVVIAIECKDSVIIINGYLVFINTVLVLLCVFIFVLIHTYFCKVIMPLKGAKKKLQQEVLCGKIADKKGLIIGRVVLTVLHEAVRVT